METELETIYYRVSLDNDGTGLIRTSIVANPAIEEEFELFDKQIIEKFEITEDERIITGPIMIPDRKMIRKFQTKDAYYNCVFTKEDILNTVKKASKEGKFNELNLSHSQLSVDMVKNVYLVESIILNDRNKIEKYSHLPNGTWIASFWVEDINYWNNVIKSSDFTGFSVEISVSMEAETDILEDMQKRTEVILNNKLLSKEEKINNIKTLLNLTDKYLI